MSKETGESNEADTARSEAFTKVCSMLVRNRSALSVRNDTIGLIKLIREDIKTFDAVCEETRNVRNSQIFQHVIEKQLMIYLKCVGIVLRAGWEETIEGESLNGEILNLKRKLKIENTEGERSEILKDSSTHSQVASLQAKIMSEDKAIEDFSKMMAVTEVKAKDTISSVNEKSDWRETSGESHLGRFRYLVETGMFSDFDFIVGLNEERIKAHKLVLRIGSPIFEAMIDEGESGDAPIKELNIPDIDPDIFKIFLKFLYTGDCTVLQSNQVIPVLRAAKTYKVPDLIRTCVEYLETAITESTALTIFQQAVEYEEKDLEERAIQLICRYAFRIVETDGLLELSSELLEKLVARDDLAVYDEIQLFEALIRWAEAECRRHGTVISNKYARSFLESLIPLIRFPQILPSEFSLKVASREILLTEEVVSVLLYHNVPLAQRSTAATNTKFSLNPRDYYVCATNCTLERLNTPAGTIKITNTWHRICFKVDTPVWMTSVGLNKVGIIPAPTGYCHSCNYGYGGNNCSGVNCVSTPNPGTSTSYMAEVRVEDYNLETIYAKKRETVLKENNTSEHYQIKFDKPVKILPNTWYTASLRVEGSYVGQNYKGSEVEDEYRIRVTSGGGSANFECKNAKEIDLDNPTCCDAGQMATLGFHIPT